MENHLFFIGKPSINGPFSIAFCMFTRPGNHPTGFIQLSWMHQPLCPNMVHQPLCPNMGHQSVDSAKFRQGEYMEVS